MLTTVKARAEDAGHDPAQRAVYDVVLARAVARLPRCWNICCRLRKIGGVCIAMKGRTAQAEADDSAHALSVLGGRIQGIETFAYPASTSRITSCSSKKSRRRRDDYPRKPGIPTRQAALAQSI